MTVEIESILKIEAYSNEFLKITLLITDKYNHCIFNEIAPLRICDDLIIHINGLINWDLTIEECLRYFSKSSKGVYNLIESHEDRNPSHVASIISKLFLDFNKYRNTTIVFKEQANYEEYFNYEQ